MSPRGDKGGKGGPLEPGSGSGPRSPCVGAPGKYWTLGWAPHLRTVCFPARTTRTPSSPPFSTEKPFHAKQGPPLEPKGTTPACVGRGAPFGGRFKGVQMPGTLRNEWFPTKPGSLETLTKCERVASLLGSMENSSCFPGSFYLRIGRWAVLQGLDVRASGHLEIKFLLGIPPHLFLAGRALQPAGVGCTCSDGFSHSRSRRTHLGFPSP